MAASSGTLTGSQGFAGAWLTVAERNAVIGYPDNPEWPGPVTEDHAGGPEENTARTGPPDGPTPAIPSTGSGYEDNLSGGVITDTQAYTFGYSAPMAPTFPQTEPFAPPGPAGQTHGYDTGGVARTEHVPMPRSPGWWRRTGTGQTWNRQAQVTDTAGWAQSAVNDRRNFNQDQGQNADGYDPFVIPYSERPLKANFAATSYPVDGGSSVYGVDGTPGLVMAGGQGDYAYTAPPDPEMTYSAPMAPAYEPTLGMEYVSG